MKDKMKLNLQFGCLVVNPLDGATEYYNYPSNASEAEIELIDRQAMLRQKILHMRYGIM